MCKKVLRIQEEASTDGMSDPLSAQLPSRIENTKGQCSYDVCKIMGFFTARKRQPRGLQVTFGGMMMTLAHFLSWCHREEEGGEGWSHRVEEEGEGERGGPTVWRKSE